MTVLIERDEDQSSQPAEVPPPPFRVWLRAWIPYHRVAAGALAGVAAIASALVVSTFFGFSATPNVPPVRPINRTVQVVTQNAAQETTALVRRDQWDDVVSRGEMLGSELFTAEQLAGISVTVTGPGATCRILIDGKVVDEASVPAEGGQTTCMWVMPSR